LCSPPSWPIGYPTVSELLVPTTIARLSRKLRATPVWGCVALAAAATLPTLGQQPLSWNEAVTLSAAQRSPDDLWALLHQTDAPLGLYYFIIHVWLDGLNLLGISATAYWLRLPSAVADIGTVAVVVLLLTRCFDRRIAAVAGIVLAVHPMMTFYAQDARPYALLTLSFVGSTAMLIAALRRPSVGRLSAYSFLATLTLYLHLFAAFGFIGHAFLIYRLARRGERRRWLVVGAAVTASVMPLVLLARTEHGEVGWIPHPTPRIVFSVVTNIFGGAGLALAMVVLGTTAMMARRPRPRPRDPRVTFLLLLVASPVLILVALDFLSPDLVARYALICAPAAATLVALAAIHSSRPVGPILAIMVIAIAASTTGVQQAQPFKYENYRQAADTMGDIAVPGSTVMFLPISTRAGYEPYSHLEPDLSRVADPAQLGPVNRVDRIGGADEPAIELAPRFDSSPEIFVLGDSLPHAIRVLHDPTDVAQLDVLSRYRTVRVIRTGDLYLSVLQQASGPTP
jgi:mannosyltransferase